MSLILFFLAYASTFYRFKYFISFLKKRQVQIVADIPHRVNKNTLLPVLTIVRNANVYPAEINSLDIYIDKQSVSHTDLNINLDQDYWEHIEMVDISDFNEGLHEIDIKITYSDNSKKYICYNDNYRGTSHKPIPCYFSSCYLPKLNGFVSAEMHSHSNFTNDQIEFGASIKASAIMARAIGLDCFSITDHSYDLDDLSDNFLVNDPDLKKWQEYKKQIIDHNKSDFPVKIIPGEEVSVRNQKNETVHLLVYNCDTFFSGCGDSGEKWLKYYSQSSINDIIDILPEEAIAFAAHPADSIPGSHKLLLNRGQWSQADASANNLVGVQIFNGHGKDKLSKAINFWTTLLVQGLRKYALAGNDAHGNFGRNRSIHVPFISIVETYTQLFGVWRTDIFLGKQRLNVSNLVNALKTGNFSVNNGPAINLSVFDSENLEHPMGSFVKYPHSVKISALSTKEFGFLKEWVIYVGNIENSSEQIYLSRSLTDSYNIDEKVKFKTSGPAYIRAEVRSEGPKGQHFAFSNPIWINEEI